MMGRADSSFMRPEMTGPIPMDGPVASYLGFGANPRTLILLAEQAEAEGNRELALRLVQLAYSALVFAPAPGERRRRKKGQGAALDPQGDTNPLDPAT